MSMKVERPCGERGVGGGKDEVDVEGKGDGEGGVVVIYCHLKKLSVGQTPRLCNLPSKSYSNINVPRTSGDDLVKESRQTV